MNAANYTLGPFAPNSILSLFGSGLAHPGPGSTSSDPQVYVESTTAYLLYVSDSQINFLIPRNQSVGPARIRVTLNGISGPEVAVTIADVAPALFSALPGYAIAVHVDNSLVTPDKPAHPGEIIVIYAGGLGKTVAPSSPEPIPGSAAQILRLADLKVSLDGTVVSDGRIQYAGITPLSVGLYQINLTLPESLTLPPESDPEIRVAIGDQTSAPGLKLAVR